MNKEKFGELLALLIKSIEEWRQKVKVINQENIDTVDFNNVIIEEWEILNNTYWHFVDTKVLKWKPENYKYAFNNLSNYIRNNQKEIFWEEMKNWWYFDQYIYFLNKKIVEYKDLQKFNEKLDWNDLIYWVDLINNKLFIKKENQVKHNAVYAITRSGKTVWLQNILYSTLDRKIYDKADNLRPEAVIIEKSADFDDTVVFKWITYKWSLEWAHTVSFKDILQMFFYVDLQYKYRKMLFTSRWVQKIQDFNKVAPDEEKIWIFFVIIDEFQSVLKKFEWNKENFNFLVSRIAKIVAVYTDAWIYLYAWTQMFGSEKWIPSNIAWNIETKLFWRYSQESDLYSSPIKDTYVTAQNISMGDLIYTQWTDKVLMRSPLPYFPFSWELKEWESINVAKTRYINSIFKNFKIKDEIKSDDAIDWCLTHVNDFMWNYLTYKIEEVLNKISELWKWNIKDIDRWFDLKPLEDAWIDIKRELSGIDRFSFVLIFHIIIQYVKEIKWLVDKWNKPFTFDFNLYKKKTISSAEITSYPMIYAQWIWEQYFEKMWNSNINATIKKIEKKLNENDTEEWEISTIDLLDMIDGSAINIYRIALENYINDTEKPNLHKDVVLP